MLYTNYAHGVLGVECSNHSVPTIFFNDLARFGNDRAFSFMRFTVFGCQLVARADVFDYIEMFYNPKRRHGFNNQLSPVEFEKRYFQSLGSV